MLVIDDLEVQFTSNKDIVHAVGGVDININPGDFIGLVGESGSGKSVTALSILNLLPSNGTISGKIMWKDNDILANPSHLKHIRGKDIGMIFQNPMTAFNPVLTIGQHFIETIQLHQNVTKKEAETIAIQTLEQVHITDSKKRMTQYPHEFSLGMCQRAMIALTLAMKPSLLIADEPTASLDVTVQAQIMDLLKEINSTMNMSILFISHDLGIIAQNCRYVYIMYLGQIVEHGQTIPIFKSPHHPYTQTLIASIPNPNPEVSQQKITIKGEIPSPLNLPKGCRFHTRCPYAMAECKQGHPTLVEKGQTISRCILA